MNYEKARVFCTIVFGVSVIGWAVFGLFFLPEDFLGSGPPLAPSTGPNNLWHFLLFFVALLTPVMSALGGLTTTILIMREEQRAAEKHG